MATRFCLPVILVVFYSLCVESQFFSRNRGKIASLRESQQLQESALDDSEQLTLLPFNNGQDYSGQRRDPQKFSAFPTLSGVEGSPRGQPPQVDVQDFSSQVLEDPTSSRYRPSVSRGAPVRILSPGAPDGSRRSQPTTSAAVDRSRQYDQQQSQSRRPPLPQYDNFVPPPVNSQPVRQVYADPQQQQQQGNNGNVRTFLPEQNPLNKGKEQRVQPLPQKESFISEQTISKDFLPTCPDATFSYIIPSPIQCDLYYLCEFGTPSRKVCDDGLVFSIEDVKCVSAERETCEGRPQLQAPKGTGACTRRNGIFYSNDTCTDFVTCRDNNPSFGQCADGLVFDAQQKICAWADEALRPGCLPEDLLGFRCPNPKLTKEEALSTRVYLRFGDHDRFADEKDCRFFFMCLTTGQPRRAGCGNGKVFDRSTGICKSAKDVPECFDYYGPPTNTRAAAAAAATGSAKAGVAKSRLLLIQDDLSKQFQSEQRRSSQRLRLKRWILEEEALPEGR